MSTAYCHLGERILYEKPYPPPCDPYEVIKTIEWMDEGSVEAMTDRYVVVVGDLWEIFGF